jgi:YopX protein
MREIKFRAWAYGWGYPNGKMIYGVAIHSPTDIRHHDERNVQDDWYKLWDKDDEKTHMKELTTENVMQFTGLKDKNGKEIYEGDIVRRNGVKSLMRIFFDETAAFRATPVNEERGRWYVDNPDEVEIVGNIYENPELLKPTKSADA